MGLAVTPLVIPAALALSFSTRGFTAIEAELARALLDVDAQVPAIGTTGHGWRDRLRVLFGPGFWRAQGYLWTRWFLGFPAGVIMISLLGTAVALISGPIWIPRVQGGGQLGFWTIHSVPQALTLVPVGFALLVLTVALARPFGDAFRPLATSFLREDEQDTGCARSGRPCFGRPITPWAEDARDRRRLDRRRTDRGLGGDVTRLLLADLGDPAARDGAWRARVVVGAARAAAAGQAPAGKQHAGRNHRRGRDSVALHGGVWAVSGHGYFWPIWTLLAAAIVVSVTFATSSRDADLADRIETLTATRAGAVNSQDSELRRIERDLHDGAQARLVALGMSLGMAEQKLAEDPARAGELLAEARMGAEHALRELRDLARGIHPPVLADRGLEAAIGSLADATQIHVALSVDVPRRPPAAIESAAYFVAAEAMANAAKHARADWLEIRIAEVGNKLEVEISDDGVGGAEQAGSGLTGLRHRVEALDGNLRVTSPPGGPTTIYAELPCAW